MLVKPAEFGMIQQQNTVSQIRHEEDAKPMAEQQTMVVKSQKEAEIKPEQVVDAKDISDNEYQSGHKKKREKTSDGKVIIKGQEYRNIDFDVKI